MSHEVPKKPDDNAFANILLNVVLPVLSLSYLSEEGGKPWHIGPTYALVLALALPIGYGVWHFAKTRKLNVFSLIGLGSVLLTGGLTLYLWNEDGTVKDNAALLFGLKEGSIPLILGLTVLISHWTKAPLLRVFLYSDSIFDVRKIEKVVKEKGAEDGYGKVLFNSTVLFAASFLISAVANVFLALHFLTGVTDKVAYNSAVAKLTGYGFLVIGLPILIFLGICLWRLLGGLQRVTGLEKEELMQAR